MDERLTHKIMVSQIRLSLLNDIKDCNKVIDAFEDLKKHSKDQEAIINLNKSIMHYEGRVKQAQQTLDSITKGEIFLNVYT